MVYVINIKKNISGLDFNKTVEHYWLNNMYEDYKIELIIKKSIR